mmetsp:Transcript_7998/g.11887  ORF Transcript_7998/g.11887 Transcript_7998/m.11887 type:complete len:571 (-) Transcript_7998:96-1808(-)
MVGSNSRLRPFKEAINSYVEKGSQKEKQPVEEKDVFDEFNYFEYDTHHKTDDTVNSSDDDNSYYSGGGHTMFSSIGNSPTDSNAFDDSTDDYEKGNAILDDPFDGTLSFDEASKNIEHFSTDGIKSEKDFLHYLSSTLRQLNVEVIEELRLDFKQNCNNVIENKSLKELYRKHGIKKVFFLMLTMADIPRHFKKLIIKLVQDILFDNADMSGSTFSKDLVETVIKIKDQPLEIQHKIHVVKHVLQQILNQLPIVKHFIFQESKQLPKGRSKQLAMIQKHVAYYEEMTEKKQFHFHLSENRLQQPTYWLNTPFNGKKDKDYYEFMQQIIDEGQDTEKVNSFIDLLQEKNDQKFEKSIFNFTKAEHELNTTNGRIESIESKMKKLQQQLEEEKQKQKNLEEKKARYEKDLKRIKQQKKDFPVTINQIKQENVPYVHKHQNAIKQIQNCVRKLAEITQKEFDYEQANMPKFRAAYQKHFKKLIETHMRECKNGLQMVNLKTVNPNSINSLEHFTVTLHNLADQLDLVELKNHFADFKAEIKSYREKDVTSTTVTPQSDTPIKNFGQFTELIEK